MKLCYRGTEYDYTPPEVRMEGFTEDRGIYRGVDIRFRKATRTLTQLPTLDLMYRGSRYRA